MTAYLIRRGILLLLTLYIVATALFFFVRFLPGDAVDAVLNTNNAVYRGDRERVERDLGLDKPLLGQYVSWIGKLARGDVGKSLWTRQGVATPVRTRGGVSFVLAMEALTVALLLGIPVGIVAALKRNSALDFFLRGATVVGLAVPAFWLGLLLVVLPSKYFQWTPAGTFVPFEENPISAMTALMLPAVALGTPAGAVLMRYVRTQMLEVISQDYVRTARSKGLGATTVVTRHALRNALIPVLSVIGIQVPALIGGSVVIERIFAIPGLGSYMLDAVQRRDYPAIQAANLFVAAIVLLSNLVVDLMYAVVDPRLRSAR